MFVLLVVYIRVVRRAGSYFVAATVFAFCCSVYINDFVSAVEANRRLWPAGIVVIDLLLVVKAPSGLTLSIVASTCVPQRHVARRSV